MPRLQPHTPRLYCDQCRAIRARARAKLFAMTHPRRLYKQSVRRKPYKYDGEMLRVRHRQWRYGLSAEQYQDLASQQNGACYFASLGGNHIGRLDVDHNHETGAVRGLLCRSCNNAVMWFENGVLKPRRQQSQITDDLRSAFPAYVVRRALD